MSTSMATKKVGANALMRSGAAARDLGETCGEVTRSVTT
jgi:hypothetical protein